MFILLYFLKHGLFYMEQIYIVIKCFHMEHLNMINYINIIFIYSNLFNVNYF